MSRFFAALWSTPPGPAPALARFVAANGVLYLVVGAGMLVGAPAVVALAAATEGFVLHDVGLVRVAGLTVAIIGWFYLIGGRSRSESFALATVVDRLLLPFVLVPLWLLGELPAGLALPFAALDFGLALGVLALWRRAPGGAG